MNIEKVFEISDLFSIYGKLLSGTQKEVLKLFYFDNFGLSEIAEIKNISRQAVKDTLIKGEKALKNFESKLKFCEVEKEILAFANKNLNEISKQTILEIFEKGGN